MYTRQDSVWVRIIKEHTHMAGGFLGYIECDVAR